MRGVALTLALVLLAPPARADREEWRYSLDAIGSSLSLDRASSTSSPLGGGGRLRVAYGLSDIFEVGAAGAFTFAGGAKFTNATVSDQSGLLQPGDLQLDVYDIELGVDGRLIVGVPLVRAFSRVRPLAGIRAGLLVRTLSSQQLLDPSTRQIILDVATDTTPLLFGAAELGVEYRLGANVIIGMVGEYRYAGNSYQSASLSLELSWMRY
jgi:hypothetical protein